MRQVSSDRLLIFRNKYQHTVLEYISETSHGKYQECMWLNWGTKLTLWKVMRASLSVSPATELPEVQGDFHSHKSACRKWTL